VPTANLNHQEVQNKTNQISSRFALQILSSIPNLQHGSVVNVPNINGVTYDASLGTLDISGSNFGQSILPDLTRFTLGKSLKLSNVSDTITNLSPNGLTIQLTADQQNVLNNLFAVSLFTTPGAMPELSVQSGWDGATSQGAGGLILAQTSGSLTVGGVNGNVSFAENVSLTPFSAITVADGNVNDVNFSAILSYNSSGGLLILKGNGLSAPIVTVYYNYSNGANYTNSMYTINANSAQALQNDLRSIVITTPYSNLSSGQTLETELAIHVSTNSRLITIPVNSGTEYDFDRSGNLYVVDSGTSNSVIEYSPSGVLIHTFSQGLASPYTMITDAQGEVFVQDQKGIEKFNSSGKLQWRVSPLLFGNSGMATDSRGDLLVADGYHDQVLIYSASGSLLHTLSQGMSQPYTITTDNQGDFYVANQYSIEKFSESGVLLNTLSQGISNINHLVTDSAGDLYIINNYYTNNVYQNSNLQEYSASGALIRTLVPNMAGDSVLLTDSRNNVYIANNINHSIDEYSATGQMVQSIAVNYIGIPGDYINLIAIDNQSNIYFTSGIGIQMINTGGHTIGSINSQTQVSVVSATISISAAAYDAAGAVLTLQGSNLDLAAKIQSTDFSLTGQDGNVYALTGGVVQIVNNSQIIVDLNAADQLAVNSLFVQNGNKAADNTPYSVSAKTGWGYGLAAQNQISLTVTNSQSPHISAIVYHPNTGELDFSGAGLAALANKTPLDISKFSFADNFSLNAKDAVLANLTVNGFSILLDSADQTKLNQLLSTAKMQPGLSAKAGWDGYASPLLTGVPLTETVNAGNLTLTGLAGHNAINDVGSYHPYAGLTISDSNVNDSHFTASVDITSGYGQLSGHNLVYTGTANGLVNYSVSAGNLTQLQSDLQSLLFSPTPGVLAVGNSAIVNANVTVTAQSTSQTLSLGQIGVQNLTVGGMGDLFAVNTTHNSISVFSSSGSLQHILTQGLANPVAVAEDNQGNVYVANMKNNTISEFNAAGRLINSLSQGISQPDSLVVNNQGDLFVANTHGNNVTEFSASGALLLTLSSEVDNPVSLAINQAGDIYVANDYSNTIEQFSASGVLLQTLIIGISSPSSIALDSQGDVFVANQGNNSVEEFSSSGKLLLTLTQGISNPVDLVTDSIGNVYVANSAGNQVQEFSKSGSLVQTLTDNLANITAIACDSNGDIFAASANLNYINEFLPAQHNQIGISDNSSQVTITAVTQVIAPGSTVASPIVLPNAGVKAVEIADARAFETQAVTANIVKSVSGGITTLAEWVAATLSSQGCNLAQHSLGWFNFAGNTYLLEQANSQGSAYGSGDSLVKITGVHDESLAGFTGHLLTLVS